MDPQSLSNPTSNSSHQLPSLTQHDTHILSQLLSPGLAAYPPTDLIDPSLPSPWPSLLELETSILAPLNTVRPSEATLHIAIDALSALIAQHPSYASAYNNRAQATRLLLGDDLRVNENVWTDLSTAITLLARGDEASASASNSSRKAPPTQVSKHEASVLGKAHTQRAWLLWKLVKKSTSSCSSASSSSASPPSPSVKKEKKGSPLEENNAKEDDPTVANPSPSSSTTPNSQQLPAQLRGLRRADREEMASRDFAMGARYGDEDARAMAVRTSPYAKLCGEIVKEAMRGDAMRGRLDCGNT